MNKLLCLFIILGIIVPGFGQSRSMELLSAYNNQDYQQLKLLYNETSRMDISRLEWEFYSALFMADGEKAKDKFQQIFDESKGQLKQLAAKKIMDYYYAKGYYINAAKYQKFLVDKETVPQIQTDNKQEIPIKKEEKESPPDNISPSEYFIQVGAFSLQDNAEQLKKMLLTQNVNTMIVNRVVNDKTLYCVWLPGKENFEKTLEYANNINEKFELKFRIIKQ